MPIAFSEGWILIHRKILKWEWVDDPFMVSLWLHLLLAANHKTGRWHGREIARGQLVTGRRRLAKQTGIPEQRLRTCLERLKSTREVTIESTNQYSIITIVNYSLYQPDKKESNPRINQQIPNEQPASNQRATTNNELNEVKKLKKRIHTTSGKRADTSIYDEDHPHIFVTEGERQSILESDELQFLVDQLEKYSNNPKFKYYQNHFQTILDWRRNRHEKGQRWFEHPEHGAGFYDERIVQHYGFGACRQKPYSAETISWELAKK